MSDISSPTAVSAATLDSVEKYVLTALFVFFAWRMIGGYVDTGSPVTLMYLADQLVVLGFILFRRAPKEISLRADDWFYGFAGTFLAILVGPPGPSPLVPMAVAEGLLLLGFAIHVAAKLTLRRSFGVVAANRGIKASGPYRIVRHPMYLGYIVSQTGIWLAGPTLANTVVLGMCWAFYVLRIRAEERVLMHDEAYTRFASSTRYRLIPGVH